MSIYITVYMNWLTWNLFEEKRWSLESNIFIQKRAKIICFGFSSPLWRFLTQKLYGNICGILAKFWNYLMKNIIINWVTDTENINIKWSHDIFANALLKNLYRKNFILINNMFIEKQIQNISWISCQKDLIIIDTL